MKKLLILVFILSAASAGAAEYVTPYAGGTGGGAYTTRCSTYKTMVGVQAKAGWYVDSIQPLCAGINADGTWNTDPVLEGMQAGGAGGAIVQLLCPRNSAVSGFQGRAGGFLERLQISCHPMGSNGLLNGNVNWISTVAGTGEGGTGTPFNFGPHYCGSAKPGKGFTGNYGAFVDRAAMICDTAIATTTAITAVAIPYTYATSTTPSVPTLSSPADNATVDVTNGATFSWTGTLPTSGYYQFCLSTDLVNASPSSCDKFIHQISGTSTSLTRNDFGSVPRNLRWFVRACNSTGGCSSYAARKVTAQVPGFGWTTPITSDILSSIGYPGSTHLLNKSMKQIINSTNSTSGRTDNRTCAECHFAGASKNYKPDTSSNNLNGIEPNESIVRLAGSSTVYYTWNQAATSGIIDYFCARVGASTDPKPGDLCEVFRKWRAGGYLP